MILLTLFGLGILLIDLMIPPEWKWTNALTAFIGVVFAAAGLARIQFAQAELARHGQLVEWAFMHCMLIDHFAIYFTYLFLAGTAVSILVSARYLEIEHEHHGEFYALMLFSVVGMICMASGYDIVLIFIGLELMAISTYVLVGFLRTDRRSNEASLKYLLLGAFSSGIFAYGLSLFYGITGSTNLANIAGGVGRIMTENTRPCHATSCRRAIDNLRWTVLQDCRHPVSSMGAGCVRRCAHQHFGIHVGCGKGRGLGNVAAHLHLGTLPAARSLRAVVNFCFYRYHDRRQPGRAHAE